MSPGRPTWSILFRGPPRSFTTDSRYEEAPGFSLRGLVARYWLTRGRGLEPLALQPLGEEIDEHLCLCRWRPRRGPHLLQWRRRCLEAREDELDPALIEQGADLPQRCQRDTEAGRRVHSGCGGDRPHRTARRM